MGLDIEKVKKRALKQLELKSKSALPREFSDSLRNYAKENKEALDKYINSIGLIGPVSGFVSGKTRSRLAQKIRNEEKWCSALLFAPNVDNESDGFAKENKALSQIRIKPYWAPGFVIQYKSVLFAPNADEEWMRGDAVVCLHFSNGYGQMIMYFKPPGFGEHFGYCCGSQYTFLQDQGIYGTPVVPLISKPFGDFYTNSDDTKKIFGNARQIADSLGSICIDLSRVIIYQLHQTFSLLDCSNVERRVIEVPRAKRRRKSKKKRQVDEFYVLDIPGGSDYWKYAEKNKYTESVVRHHAVRGHFKTYTDEAPLFGSKTGTFWIPSHARGNPDLGCIEKDYSMTDNSKAAAS